MKATRENLYAELEIALAGKDSKNNCASRLGLSNEYFYKLLARAKIHGAYNVAFCRRVHSPDFKLQVVASIKDGLSFTSASKLYNLDKTTIKDWVRLFDLHGPDYFLKEHRGEKRGGVNPADNLTE